MTHVIAITNQKGGVGKTTSAINISSELANMGRRVLLVDFDPQGNATSGLGVQVGEEGRDLYDMFFGKVSLLSILRDTKIENLKVAPSSKNLIGIEIELGKSPGRELILRSQIRLQPVNFDYIIIDCPPSSGLLNFNALGAADKVLIPLQAEYYALEGVSALIGTLEFVKHTFNTTLDILGVFMTMYDNRTNLATQVMAEAQGFFHDLMFQTVIPRNIKLSESPSHGLPICLYDKSSAGAIAYRKLTQEIDDRCNRKSTIMVAANG